jgi:4-oxalocrotonate tautomerase
MPYVNVRILKEGVTAAQKVRVIRGITDVLVEVLGKDPNATFVVIDEVETDNWGWKSTSVTELRKAAKPKVASRSKARKTQTGPVTK